MCVYHNFFICSFVDGQLSCFCILAGTNNGAVNTGVQLSFQVSVFIFFKVEFLDHLVVLFLIWGGFI